MAALAERSPHSHKRKEVHRAAAIGDQATTGEKTTANPIQQMANQSPVISQLKAIQRMANQSPQVMALRDIQGWTQSKGQNTFTTDLGHPASHNAPGVIQRRGALNHQKIAQVDKGAAEEVGIGAWAATEGGSLYSTGYAGCLAVVVNDQEEDRGALAHIYDGDISAAEIAIDPEFDGEERRNEILGKYEIDPETWTNEAPSEQGQDQPKGGTVLVNSIVEKMVQSTGKPRDQLDCMVWAGFSFNSEGGKVDSYIAQVPTQGWQSYLDETKQDAGQMDYGTALRYDSPAARVSTGQPIVDMSQGQGNMEEVDLDLPPRRVVKKKNKKGKKKKKKKKDKKEKL